MARIIQLNESRLKRLNEHVDRHKFKKKKFMLDNMPICLGHIAFAQIKYRIEDTGR